MLRPGPARKLVITINEGDRWHGRNLYQALLDLLRHRGLAGATAIRAIAGFTDGGPVHTANIVDLASELPVRIEVVDTPEAITAVLPDVYDMVERGLVEVQDTQVVKAAAPGGRKAGAMEPKAETVRLIGRAKMLRVHIGANDHWEGEPLYEALVKRARQMDLAGATVYRGVLGYGAQGRIHRHRALSLADDDPIMITVIDTEEKINRFVAAIDAMIPGGCLLALSDVSVIRYEPRGAVTPLVPDAPPKPG